MVPDNSTGIPRVPAYSGADPDDPRFRVRGSHPLRPGVPSGSATARRSFDRSYNPASASLRTRFGLFPVRSPLLGESCLLSFPAGTWMFQFPAFASMNPWMTGSLPPGCPIRISAGQRVFAPRRSFSQLITSFFASESPGIPHTPLVTLLFLSVRSPGLSVITRLASGLRRWFYTLVYLLVCRCLPLRII